MKYKDKLWIIKYYIIFSLVCMIMVYLILPEPYKWLVFIQPVVQIMLCRKNNMK